MAKQQFPEPTVGALIFNPKGEALFVKSHKWHGQYVIPGGHVELGERLEDALRREVREETGLEIHSPTFICWQDFLFDPAYHKPKHYIFLDFACKTDSIDVHLNEEGQEYVWTTPHEALQLALEPYTRKTLEAYLSRHTILR